MSTLVIGGTGKTGTPIVRGLRELGVDVLIATRTSERVFDWRDPSTHEAALAGVDRLYAISPLGDDRPQERMIPFFERALGCGVERIVMLSSSAVTEDMPGLGEVDRWLRTHAPQWTVLRPSWFMQNFTDPGMIHPRTIAAEGVIYSATGQGRVPFVDVADIAAVAVRALVDEAAHDTAHRITGPAALTYDDIASLLGVRHVALSPGELAAHLARHGVPETYGQLLAALDTSIAAGAEAEVSDVVERVTGRVPRSFRAFLSEGS